jgi:CRP-like cAMP-binding protein
MQAFADNPWFASLLADDAQALLAAATPLRLPAGQAAFLQGDELEGPGARAFFGLRSGLLKLQILSPEGRETILSLVEPGNWIGEVSALEGTPRAYAAVALEDSELLAVTAQAFDRLMDRAGFARAMARLTAQRLRLCYGLLVDVALQPMQMRVARRLLLLVHGGLSQHADGRNRLGVSQDLLATMLGISRPTLNKELQALAELGLIALRYGRIEILDPPGLRERCKT